MNKKIKRVISIVITIVIVSVAVYFGSYLTGRGYWYRFDYNDIQSIVVVHHSPPRPDPDATLNFDTYPREAKIKFQRFEWFLKTLKNLDYIAYLGTIKSVGTGHVEILLKNNTHYIFELNYIIKNGKRLKYRCEDLELTMLLHYWCS
jgi:hypothetical protein